MGPNLPCSAVNGLNLVLLYAIQQGVSKVRFGVSPSLELFCDQCMRIWTINSIEKSTTKYRGTSFIQGVSLAAV
jgi:hypothetical protein